MVISMRSIAGLVGFVAVVVPAAASAQQSPSPAMYRPGLGDLMTMMVQPRHTKLGLAGYQANWPYAAYELHELQEAFDRVVAVSPKWRTFSISEMVASVLKEPMAATEQAIKAHDAGQFATAYEQLTAACNTCHQSADRGVIVIQQPTSSPFPDQDFAPRAQRQ
jgi:hypothetical protein